MATTEFRPKDLEQPISGMLVDALKGGFIIEEGQLVRLSLHTANARRRFDMAVNIDQVGIHLSGEHLETFSGIEFTEPSTPPTDKEWGPGKRISGIWNHKRLFFVFLTEVDGMPVAQEQSFYNTEIDRTKY